MVRTAKSLAAAAAALLYIVLSGGVAEAQAARTWVSGVGDDANPCSRTAPCKTFAGAISKTAAGGEISVLDPGGYGAVTITKSISITNDNSGEAGILASGASGIVINGAGVIVNLRGLVIDGGPPATTGSNGINFLQGAELHVQNCVIKNFRAAASTTGFGIRFVPNGNANLYVTDCVISSNGDTVGNTGGGVNIEPSGTATVVAVLNRVNIENNLNGIRASSGATTGAVTVTVTDSTASGNKFNGVVAIAAGGNPAEAQITVDRATIAGNGANGLRADGLGAVTRVSNSVITGHANAVGVANSGVVESFQNNDFRGNTSIGTLTPVAPQ